jgi:hypothetical protein
MLLVSHLRHVSMPRNESNCFSYVQISACAASGPQIVVPRFSALHALMAFIHGSSRALIRAIHEMPILDSEMGRRRRKRTRFSGPEAKRPTALDTREASRDKGRFVRIQSNHALLGILWCGIVAQATNDLFRDHCLSSLFVPDSVIVRPPGLSSINLDNHDSPF